MRTHWGPAGIVLVITIAQRLVYFLDIWFIYLALGLSGSTVIEVIILQSFISVCIDILPAPGGVGANEGFSVVMFRTIMQNQYVYPAMLLSRGISYYALVLISAVMTGVAHVTIKRKE